MFGISDNKRNASTCNLINDKGAMNNDKHNFNQCAHVITISI